MTTPPPTFRCRAMRGGYPDHGVDIIVIALEPQRFWGTKAQNMQLARDFYGDDWRDDMTPAFVVREPTEAEAKDEADRLLTWLSRQEYEADRRGAQAEAALARGEMAMVQDMLAVSAANYLNAPPAANLGEYAARPAWAWTMAVVELRGDVPSPQLIKRRRGEYWNSWA